MYKFIVKSIDYKLLIFYILIDIPNFFENIPHAGLAGHLRLYNVLFSLNIFYKQLFAQVARRANSLRYIIPQFDYLTK